MASNVFLSDEKEVYYRVDGKDLVQIPIEILKDSQNPLYSDALLLLLEFRDERVLPALRKALQEVNPQFVATAAYALGEIRDKQSVDSLIELFNKYGI